MLIALQGRLNVLPLRAWAVDALRLLLAAVGLAAWALQHLDRLALDWLGRLLQVGLSSALGLLLFVGIGRSLGVPEVEELTATITRRFSRR